MSTSDEWLVTSDEGWLHVSIRRRGHGLGKMEEDKFPAADTAVNKVLTE
jgi:hypothetical protein